MVIIRYLMCCEKTGKCVSKVLCEKKTYFIIISTPLYWNAGGYEQYNKIYYVFIYTTKINVGTNDILNYHK